MFKELFTLRNVIMNISVAFIVALIFMFFGVSFLTQFLVSVVALFVFDMICYGIGYHKNK